MFNRLLFCQHMPRLTHQQKILKKFSMNRLDTTNIFIQFTIKYDTKGRHSIVDFYPKMS